MSAFLAPYYTLPVHFENSDGTTDYCWEANGRWSKMTEGFAFGRFDENGFNNQKAIANPDVLILGSSHIEATNVLQKDSVTFLLNDLLSDRNLQVYNKGVSGHAFSKVVSHLKANIDASNPPIVVIETSTVSLTEDEIKNAISNKSRFKNDANNAPKKGLLYYLQVSPFSRLLWNQISHGLFELFGLKTTKAETQVIPATQSDYDELFDFIDSQRKNYNGKIIVFYHPTGKPEKNGSLRFETDENALRIFSSECEKHKIAFLDMTQTFQDEWENHHRSARGFTTGTAFSGHLNSTGHRLVAECLANEISKELRKE